MSNSEKAVETIFATEKRIQGHIDDLDEARVRAYAQVFPGRPEVQMNDNGEPMEPFTPTVGRIGWRP